MSELINNRERRRKILKSLIAQLHDGRSIEEVRQQFAAAFTDVDASEISEAEQALIADGMPVTEVQRLCDVHAAVFKGSIAEIHRQQDPPLVPDHPVQTLKRENRALEQLIAVNIEPLLNHLDIKNPAIMAALRQAVSQLARIDSHYQKKENLLFPYLERYGITAPPKVMWGVDDEIRGQIRTARAAVESGTDPIAIKAAVNIAADRVKEMIFKEENIMLPMALQNLKPDDWRRIAAEIPDLGYCLIEAPRMAASLAAAAGIAEDTGSPAAKAADDLILPTGLFKLPELVHMLDALPLDITFVDQDDTVKYFSQGRDRIFPRTRAVIGRKVVNCHPPASMPVVEKILASFRSGASDHEDFWIRMGERLVLIRYYAVRGEAGEYLGTLEVTQDIAPIQAIQGEKRILSQ